MDAAQLQSFKKFSKSDAALRKARKKALDVKKAASKKTTAKKHIGALIPPSWFKPLSFKVNKLGQSQTPSVAEDRIRTLLNGYSFAFHYEVSFKGLISVKNQPLRFDFYIPSLNVLIEYDGKGFHSDAEVKERDKLKNRFCKFKKITLLRYNAKNWETLEVDIIRVIAERGHKHTK